MRCSFRHFDLQSVWKGRVVYLRSTFSSSLRRPLVLAIVHPSTHFRDLYDVYVGGVGYLASENFSLLSLESHLFTTTRVFTAWVSWDRTKFNTYFFFYSSSCSSFWIHLSLPSFLVWMSASSVLSVAFFFTLSVSVAERARCNSISPFLLILLLPQSMIG